MREAGQTQKQLPDSEGLLDHERGLLGRLRNHHLSGPLDACLCEAVASQPAQGQVGGYEDFSSPLLSPQEAISA